MEARLYTIPGSHPGMATRAMLEYKGIPYKRTDLFPVMSKGILRALGFPGKTVPALKIDGRKVQGSRPIARELERLQPQPALFPDDPEHRAAVEEAERFGDEELQHPIRQISWWSIKKDSSSLRSYSEGAKLGIPIGLAVKTAAPIVALAARTNEATDENVRRDLAALPGFLDKIDAWIEAGSEPTRSARCPGPSAANASTRRVVPSGSASSGSSSSSGARTKRRLLTSAWGSVRRSVESSRSPSRSRLIAAWPLRLTQS